MRDVCFQVYEQVGESSVRGCWINIALGEPFPIGSGTQYAIETIEIKDPENWRSSNTAKGTMNNVKSRAT